MINTCILIDSRGKLFKEYFNKDNINNKNKSKIFAKRKLRKSQIHHLCGTYLNLSNAFGKRQFQETSNNCNIKTHRL